jgi:hypothetical protein
VSLAGSSPNANDVPAPARPWYRRDVHDELHEHPHGDDDIPTTSLLREARGAYALAIREVLDQHGVGDVPPNSAFLLGGLRAGVPFEALARQRRRAIERSGVVDALVDAGCVRRVDDDVELTERGHQIATACAVARDALDRHVADAIGADGYRAMRSGLIALIDWKEAEEERR